MSERIQIRANVPDRQKKMLTLCNDFWHALQHEALVTFQFGEIRLRVRDGRITRYTELAHRAQEGQAMK